MMWNITRSASSARSAASCAGSSEQKLSHRISIVETRSPSASRVCVTSQSRPRLSVSSGGIHLLYLVEQLQCALRAGLRAVSPEDFLAGQAVLARIGLEQLVHVGLGRTRGRRLCFGLATLDHRQRERF